MVLAVRGLLAFAGRRPMSARPTKNEHEPEEGPAPCLCVCVLGCFRVFLGAGHVTPPAGTTVSLCLEASPHRQ